MTIGLLVVALLLASSTVHAQAVDPKPIAAFMAGSILDMETTVYALTSSPNVREGNPVLQVGGPQGLVIVKSVFTAGIALALVRLSRHGHPKAAATLGYVGGIVLSGIAFHNVKVLNDAP